MTVTFHGARADKHKLARRSSKQEGDEIMILVRSVLQAKSNKGEELVALLKEITRFSQKERTRE